MITKCQSVVSVRAFVQTKVAPCIQSVDDERVFPVYRHSQDTAAPLLRTPLITGGVIDFCKWLCLTHRVERAPAPAPTSGTLTSIVIPATASLLLLFGRTGDWCGCAHACLSPHVCVLFSKASRPMQVRGRIHDDRVGYSLLLPCRQEGRLPPSYYLPCRQEYGP